MWLLNSAFCRGASCYVRTSGRCGVNVASSLGQRRHGVPFPPRAGQTRIVAEVERRLSVVEESGAVVSANLQRATRLRQSILQSAFTIKLLTADSADDADKK